MSGRYYGKGNLNSTLESRQHWAQYSSRIDKNVAWKGRLPLDHCDQSWAGRREGPRQAEPSFRILPLPRSLSQALTHILLLDSHSSFGSWMVTKAHFTNKETEPKRLRGLAKVAQVRSIAGFGTRPAHEPQRLPSSWEKAAWSSGVTGAVEKWGRGGRGEGRVALKGIRFLPSG